MTKCLFIGMFSLWSYCTIGQQAEPFTIIVKPAVSSNDSFSFYKVELGSHIDSVICILRSASISLGIDAEPSYLVPLKSNDTQEQYNLQYALYDSTISVDVPFIRGSLILPGHALYFQVKVPVSKKRQYLTVEYFNIYDVSYREFEDRMKYGNWFKKYHLNAKTVLLPGSHRK